MVGSLYFTGLCSHLVPDGAYEVLRAVAAVGAARAQVAGHGRAHVRAPVAAHHHARAPL